MARVLSAFPRQQARRHELKPAAVAIYASERAGASTLLLTRRATGLRAHSRQRALPDDRDDAGERAANAALRQLEEEVGLRLHPDGVLGVLNDYVTGYLGDPGGLLGRRRRPSGRRQGSRRHHHVPLEASISNRVHQHPGIPAILDGTQTEIVVLGDSAGAPYCGRHRRCEPGFSACAIAKGLNIGSGESA